jgi:hypothetical protein
MVGLPFRQTITGLSSTGGFATYFPDIYAKPPFNIGIGVTVNSSAVVWEVDHSFDYLGSLSSNFDGWISSAAFWFAHSTLAGQSSGAVGNYAFPVTAIRGNVVSGSSTGQVTFTFAQAG